MPEGRLIAFAGGAVEARSLVALMEAEFLVGKGRRGGLRDFYPDVFASPAMGRLYGLLGADGEPLAALGARLFRMRRDEARLQGAMIGFVVTRPEHRGRGLGVRLMEETVIHLRDSGFALGVLWTRRHDLYLKCGWQIADPSLVGRWQGGGAPAANATWTRAPFQPALRRRLDRQRPQHAIERPALIYDKLPYPCRRLWAVTMPGAYALVGEAGDTGHAFEWGGDPDRASRLLATAAMRWPDLRLRGAVVDPVSRHLGDAGLVAFEPNPAGMWHSLATRFRPRDAVWIPYLDRI